MEEGRETTELPAEVEGNKWERYFPPELRDETTLATLKEQTKNEKVALKYETFLGGIQSLQEQTKRTVLRGFSLAITKHQDQIYPIEGGVPYGYHLVSVASKVREFGVEEPMPILLALWHDLIEDKHMTEEELKTYLKDNIKDYEGIDPDRIVTLLARLNRETSSGAYSERTENYYQSIGQEKETLVVKCADLSCNVGEYADYLDYYLKSQKIHLLPKYFGEFMRFLAPNQNFRQIEFKGKVEQGLRISFREMIKKLSEEDIERFQNIAGERYGYNFREVLGQFQQLKD
jgi:(p)ppGpp synthase/HD superfamily hydrolase